MTMDKLLISILFSFVLLISCRSAYEEIRTSNDPQRILTSANKYFEEGDFLKAQALYELAIPFFRGKKEAEDLFYNYSYTYYNLGQYTLASHYFNSFAKTFYNSPKKEEMAFMSAYANYELSPSYKLDQKPSRQAIEDLQAFINNYPSSPRVDQCNELIDELRLKLETKAFEKAKLYYQLKNYQSAMSSFENLLKDFPETKRREEINFLIIQSSYLLAKNSIYEKMEERLQNTIKKCNKFATKYPTSENLSELGDIKDFCNNELKRFVQ